MFLQLIRTHVRDAAAVHHALHRWVEELSPAAEGWLGTTAGLTDDGTFLGVARFDSGDAARRNSDRPEQGEWWEATSELFSGDVTFHDCPEVEVMGPGGSDDAGFVQVIEGRSRDFARARELYRQNEEQLRSARPDVLGGLVGLREDGQFTQVMYFTTEEEARHGERRHRPDASRAVFEEMRSLVESPTYYDLRDPWLWSPTSHRG
ncbi:MAG: hypothetical protein ACLGIA_09355 [Actinomycetes bacterium]